MDSQNQTFINTLEVYILENAICPPAVQLMSTGFQVYIQKNTTF